LTPNSFSILARSASIAALSPNLLMTISAPSLARARAIAKPMPLVEPVTRAWRLASDIGVSPHRTARRDRPRESGHIALQ